MIMLRMISSLFHSRDEEKRAVRKMVPRSRGYHVVRWIWTRGVDSEQPWLHAVLLSRGGPSEAGIGKMRLLLAIIVIIYLVGVGVVLSPIIRSTWTTEPASVLADHVVQALPDALTWPMKAARAFAGS
jgi:hypothetical protein